MEKVTKATVYIEESNSMADVTFPSLPRVVSLLHYDDAARTPDNLHPPAGYPVICITVSNPTHQHGSVIFGKNKIKFAVRSIEIGQKN